MSEETKLNLRVGGKYITRDGTLVEILWKNPDPTCVYPFCMQYEEFITQITESGKSHFYCDCPDDIVAEYVEPEAPKLNLRVGGKYVTRGGDIVEVTNYAENYPYGYPYLAQPISGSYYGYTITPKGLYWYHQEDTRDLIAEYVEPTSGGTHTLYLNVYRDGVKVHKFLEDAEAWAGPDRIRCEVIQIKY